jgi:flagellar hook-basal body complex protein FliE
MNISFNSLPASLGSTVSHSATPGSGGFADVLGAAINQVETARATATEAVNNLLVGGQGDIHNVALAAQRASLSLEMFQQVRNKFVSAYQEIMRMPM